MSGDRADADELVLRCRVAGHRFALPVEAVVEVHRAVAVEPLPDAPEGILGLVDVRGDLVPVLDLRRRLGLPARPVAPSDALVMVSVSDRHLLVLVDEATSVEAIPAASLRDAEELVPGAVYLRDVAATPTGPLVIHDLGAFLSTVDLTQLEAALRAREATVAGRP